MKKLENYSRKQLQSISYLLNKPANTYRAVSFHRLRVRIKKLHALLDLFDACFDDFKKKKIFSPFDEIFKHAGKVRELQLEETAFKKYAPNSFLTKYKAALKKDRVKAQQLFFSVLKKTSSSLVQKTMEQLKPYIKKIKKRKIENYLKKNRDEIKEIFDGELSQNKQIHELRKQLKKLQYIQKSTGMDDSDKLFAAGDKLSEVLGKWHDSRVMIKHLEDFSSKKMSPAEQRQLEKIKLNFNSKCASLLLRINTLLPN